ncbi:ATP-dependent DNA helicase RecG [Niabella agricola]|uniref:ATP-dependent DNA helicase RecG n=1 Tax=Niabella agricola TaxID=2891571 RepID=UPI002102C5A9|nr:ATP-dependent DNA helicase RecG [Niabella agricola]
MSKAVFISGYNNILSSPIGYLKGVGPQRAELLQKELGVFTFGDLLLHYPFRHVDKTRVTPVAALVPGEEYAQVAGLLSPFELIGERRARRLTAQIRDKTGTLELVWFQSISLIQKVIQPGQPYLVYGKVSFFMGKPQIVHPEMEPWDPERLKGKDFLEPVYPSTEKLKAKNLGGRQIGKLTAALVAHLTERDLPENLPLKMRESLRLMPRFDAFRNIHFPQTAALYEAAVRRLKFEEIFFAQLRMNLLRWERHRFSRGVVFEKVGELFNRFYKECLPFELTNAQKRVLKEIRIDTGRGKQMNRLLQGDVGSGKTIVALLNMLLAADNGFQAVLMAPTEILARQHFQGIKELLEPLPVEVAILTGTTKGKERRLLLERLAAGEIQILVGTHAVIEDPVKFFNLGLVIVDEQHRFGVAQRARLWDKAPIPPHVLVMTATPIPRTLAMTAYGDLDYSVIDELPPGRKPIQTVHRYENDRSMVMDFLKAEIALGRQVYVIFPLIEESEKLDYENLMQGYEEIKTYFPEPQYWISMVHGKMPAHQKEENMRRFVTHDTQIMVATTVIEVGVNVPNASVMLIESSEKFGLSQLHQLRGRVGRGAEKSYCILLTGKKLGNEARERMKIMTSTNNGFVIAEKDLELRGPGEIEGTRQSGALSFKLVDIVNDRAMVEAAKQECEQILKEDPDLSQPEHEVLKDFLRSQKGKTVWSKIS